MPLIGSLKKVLLYDSTIDITIKQEVFWTEFSSFQDKTVPFDKKNRWNTADVACGCSYKWHDKYSVPHTEVLGLCGISWTSKPTGIGIGSCERS